MAKNVKAFLLSSTILALLLFSAFGTITVHADDGPGAQGAGEETAGTSGDDGQPPGDQTDVVNPVDDGNPPTDAGTVEATPTADPATGEVTPPTEQTDVVTPTDEAGQPTDAAAVEATPAADPSTEQTDVVNSTGEASQPTDVADGSVPADLATGETAPAAAEEAAVQPAETILEQVPDNTTVTVLNTDGEAVPLASQAAADAIASDYDPIWCPAGQTTPTPGANGCTQSFGSFDELLSYLQAHETEATYQQSGTIYVQQGQYQGGESSIDFNNYTFNNINNYDLTVQGGWDTVNNTVTGTTSFDVPIVIGSSSNPWIGSLTINNLNISGVADQAALTLYSQGDITLSNVAVTNSDSGADLNAGSDATDDVTITDSEFNNNQKGGAKVKAGGVVNVSNSQFNGNSSSNQDGYGLNINSGAGASLSQVHADNNELYGADITSNGNVTVTGSFFSGNQSAVYASGWQIEGFGLQVTTTGNIKLDGVTANGNYLFGTSLTGMIVDVANSSFSENTTDWAEHITGSGLRVVSTGNVTLASVTANNNQLFGANIQTSGAVSVTNSFFNGNAAYNYTGTGDRHYEGYGLNIVTTREVSLLNVEAEHNYLYGAHIEAKDIAIDTGRFSNNGSGNGLDLTGYGLEVISLNDVAIAAVTANNNQLFGANVVATNLVAIERSTFSGHIAYVYDQNSGKIASRDGGYGLRVVTTGDISLEDVSADNNYLYGAYLEGNDTDVAGKAAPSSFSGNGSGIMSAPPGDPFGYGLKIVSTGDVTLFNINDANSLGNQLFGADITAEGDVTIGDAFFSNNQSVTFVPGHDELTFYGYGLKVVTPGDINLDLVVANFNNLWGGSLTGGEVVVTNSQFNNNISDSNIFIDDTGLIVNASGHVELFNVEAKENRLIGARITAQGPVFITQGNFIDNRGFTCSLNWCPAGSITYHGYGLQVTTPSLIIVTDTNASGNNLFGAQLNGGEVTVTGGTFNDNRLGDGLIINATNNVTLTNVTAVNNGGDGVDVTGACGMTVQVTGGTFTGNDLYGLKVVNAILNMDGTQVFANNGSGDFFTAPGNCTVAVALLALQAPGTLGSSTTLSVNASTAETSVVSTDSAATASAATWHRIIDHGVVKKFGHVWNATYHRSELGFRGLGRCTPR